MSSQNAHPRSKLGAGDKTQAIVWRAGLVLSAGTLALAFLVAINGSPGREPQIGAGLVLIVLYTGSFMVGAFLGFLFGLPRARVVEQTAGAQSDSGTALSHFLANSNLIKVSDWLTTIIIGLTLVNLGELIPAATALGDTLSEPLGGHPYSAAIGLAVVIGSVLAGFFLVYLWTSIRVRELLEEAERSAARFFVPDLEGLTLADATRVALSLEYEVVLPPNVGSDQPVTRQDPAPRTKAAANDQISLSFD